MYLPFFRKASHIQSGKAHSIKPCHKAGPGEWEAFTSIVILSGHLANRPASEAQYMRPANARLVLLQPQQRLPTSLTLDQRDVLKHAPYLKR